MKWPDLMVDIEALGKAETSIITQIAARPFNIKTGEVSEESINIKINAKRAEKLGLTLDADTVLWWLGQAKEAQTAAFKGAEQSPLGALALVKDFIKENCRKEVGVWQHTGYDARLLDGNCRVLGVQPIVSYRNWKDIRALTYLSPGVDEPAIPFEGVPHDAMADVDHQIKYCVAAYSRFDL